MGTPRQARIVLKRHDSLGKHGYKGVKSLSKTDRQHALLGAIAEFGTTYVIRKLNVLAIYNKNKDPALSKLFRDDIRFVQRVRDEARVIHSSVTRGSAARAGSKRRPTRGHRSRPKRLGARRTASTRPGKRR